MNETPDVSFSYFWLQNNQLEKVPCIVLETMPYHAPPQLKPRTFPALKCGKLNHQTTKFCKKGNLTMSWGKYICACTGESAQQQGSEKGVKGKEKGQCIAVRRSGCATSKHSCMALVRGNTITHPCTLKCSNLSLWLCFASH